MMHRVAAVWAAIACAPLTAQFRLPVSPDVLVVGRFRTPLPYETVLQRLDRYYEEQIGRKVAVALPRITSAIRYDVWHDMWIFFEPAGDGLAITMKHAADSVTARLGKGWMMEIAGRAQGELPIEFKELPPLHSVEGDLFASRHDLVRALASQPSMTPIPTWEHAGLIVSGSPLAGIVLGFGGPRGVHHVTVTAESAATAKQLLATLIAAANKPCICAVYSETADLDEEIGRTAREKAEDIGTTTTQQLYVGQVDPKLVEDRLRTDPETQKRVAAAAGYYAIRYRIDKPYALVNVRWTALEGYNREDGKFQAERPQAQISIAAPRMPAAGPPLTGRTKSEALKPGAYRITMEGELAGQKVKIDERNFWFDGKRFEEL
jgi:hypothetical protein